MKGKRKYIFTAVMLAVLLFIGNAAASFWASMKAEQDISMGTDVYKRQLTDCVPWRMARSLSGLLSPVSKITNK